MPTARGTTSPAPRRRALCRAAALVATLGWACAHALTPAQEQLKKQGDCTALLDAADLARVREMPDAARALIRGCPQDRFLALVAAAPPAEALLLCGRARRAVAARGEQPSCEESRVADLQARLHPRITVGPPDPEPVPDPALSAALVELGPALNLFYEGDDPMVIVGRLSVSLEHQTTPTYAAVPDVGGKRRTVPVTQHRFVARVEGQVELAGKTRTLRASEEARDATWEAVPRLGIAGKADPQVPPEDELRKRAGASWLRVLARNLANAPPVGVDTADRTGCAAYALALRADTGDPDAAAGPAGDSARVAACEKLFGLVPGAGLPAP
ncbi:MAG: hypothetical protein NVSMB23_23610 [Myxococcales bacterium]